MKTLFISPHYDDAVFSCGKYIAIAENPTVITVFGGVPKNKDVCTAYDQKSGFDNAEQAVLSRRSEDAVALTLLGAEQLYMDIAENQYGENREDNLKTIEGTLKDLIKDEKFNTVYVPLGLQHPDHEILGEICRNLPRKDCEIYLYMDMPYYVDNPEIATDALRKHGELSYTFRGGDLGKKMIAVSCYKSQFSITNVNHLLADERYYRLP